MAYKVNKCWSCPSGNTGSTFSSDHTSCSYNAAHGVGRERDARDGRRHRHLPVHAPGGRQRPPRGNRYQLQGEEQLI